MRKCPACGAYTFKESCAKCSVKTSSPAPPRFSPEDRYGRYRRMLIQDDNKDSGA